MARDCQLGNECQILLCCDVFLLCQFDAVNERLHWCFAETPSALMWPVIVICFQPLIQVALQLFDGAIELFAEGNAVEFVQHGLVKAFADTVSLG